MANSLLVLVPHKTLHGTISYLIQRTKLALNVGTLRALKNKMPLIPQRPGLAQSAAAEMPGDGWSCMTSLTIILQMPQTWTQIHTFKPGWQNECREIALSLSHTMDVLSTRTRRIVSTLVPSIRRTRSHRGSCLKLFSSCMLLVGSLKFCPLALQYLHV